MKKPADDEQALQSMLAVPMICSNRVMGFIGLDSVKEERMWAGDTDSLLKIVGQVFANALENKKTRQALQQSEEHLRTVFETFPDPVGIKGFLMKPFTIRELSKTVRMVLDNYFPAGK